MRKLCVILGFIAAVLAVVLAVTPFSKMALIPAIIAFVFGLVIFYISKEQSKKVIQYIFLLTIISVVITTYKAVFNKVEVGNTEELEDRVKESEEDSKEILEDLDLEEIDFEDIETIEDIQ
jgi:membrane-bound ClpP family serine protease